MVRIGIVGCGGMGMFHARYIAAGEVHHARLTAVCDSDPARLRRLKDELGNKIAYFQTPQEMFESGQVDGVIIATPHKSHPLLACEAFEHGLHVLTEKPAGVDVLSVRRMNEAARTAGTVFSIMFQERTRPVYRRAKELLESGWMGRIMRADWVCTRWLRTQHYYDADDWRGTWKGEGGGVLLNQCPHQLDLWQWLCGMPSRVFARCHFGKYHDIEVEDEVYAVVDYPDGASGMFVASTAEYPGVDRLEVAAERGLMRVEGNTITVRRVDRSVLEYIATSSERFAAGLKASRVVEELPEGGGHSEITANWVSVILGEEEVLIAPGEEGLNSLELSCAMLLSAWTSGTIDLPVDGTLFQQELQKRIEMSAYGGKNKNAHEQ